jgi:hypothetical protein
MLAYAEGEALAKSIENGSPNVTIDDAQRSQGTT